MLAQLKKAEIEQSEPGFNITDVPQDSFSTSLHIHKGQFYLLQGFTK